MKKIVIIILILIILASLGLIVYSVANQGNFRLPQIFNSNQTQQTEATTSQTNEASLFPTASQTTSGELGTSSLITSSSSPSYSTSTINSTQERLVVEELEVAGLGNTIVNKKLVSLFVNRENGNIYRLDEQNNLIRLSFATIPAISEAYWATNGNLLNIILRQTKNSSIINQVGQLKLSSSTEPAELKYREWKLNPSSIAISPNGQKLAYLNEELGKGVLYMSDWSLQKPKKLWSSDLSDWTIAWPSANIITISSKPSYNYPGLTYVFDLQTNKTRKILSNISGLTISLSPDGTRAIYSKSLANGFSLYAYDLKTGESRLLNVSTLPEKCSWFDASILYCAVPRTITDSHYPDSWYQGKVSFSDDIWKINLQQKTSVLVDQPRGSYDLFNLTINKDSAWLHALSRGDSKLQAFKLKP